MGAEVIFVGCKMPNGVVLNLSSYEVLDKERGLVRRTGEERGTVTLKGNNTPFGQADLTVDGYRFTPVPADFWVAWLAEHSDSPLLKDGYIVQAKTEADQRPVAAERRDEPGQFARLTETDRRVRGLGVKAFDKEDA